MNPARAALLNRALLATASVEGDIVECGVYQGTTLRQLAAWEGNGRTVWGFDSFQGYRHTTVGFENTSLYLAYQTADLPNVRLVPGWFAQTLTEFATDWPRPIALLHIDCGTEYSTVLTCLLPKLSPGAWVVMDEYGATKKYPDAGRVADDVLGRERIVRVDDYRAYWVKP